MKTTIRLFPIVLAFLSVTVAPQAGATCQEGCDTTNFNTFLGDDALVNNTNGFGNTAIGSMALVNNTNGDVNTATGYNALYSNTTGFLNTATGSGALYSNTTGNGNTAIGEAALTFNTTGYLNTVIGQYALDQNTTGYSNTTIGSSALLLNTTGIENTATGASALARNTTGNNNIALGFQAGQNLSTGDNNIDLGNVGVNGESNTIRIGAAGTQTATFIAGIREARFARGTAVAVGITDDGQLGVRASSARFNEAIQPLDEASEAIFSLQPVTFHYKHELDPEGIPQFGLVAEQVEKVNPDLVARDEQGKPYTVRYEAVNAMLLNEFLKEHKAFVEEQRTVEELKKQVAVLTAGLQKVSAQLEIMKPTPQTVSR